nr:hypothetical protein CFP56_79518 [Quercus suber]
MGPPARASKLCTFTRGLLKERAKSSESSRRRALPGTGPEAAEHKVAAEEAQRYVAAQRGLLRQAGCERVRRRIFHGVSEAHSRGTITERQWLAWTAENPGILEQDIRGRPRARVEVDDDDEVLQVAIWEQMGFNEWSFDQGERKEDERVQNEVVCCGPRGEVVTLHYQPPDLEIPALPGKIVGRHETMCRAIETLSRWAREVRRLACSGGRKRERGHVKD